jgi:hypothetical protein
MMNKGTKNYYKLMGVLSYVEENYGAPTYLRKDAKQLAKKLRTIKQR